MSSIVIGLGETGQPLYEILSANDSVERVDPYKGITAPIAKYQIMNICLPYTAEFVRIVCDYQDTFQPDLIIIHSTVPVGTTARIKNAVHSPILGDHTNMKKSILWFTKWVGGEKAEEAAGYMSLAGIRCREVRSSSETELLKLMCLAKYGMSIAFSQYQKDIMDGLGFDYAHVIEWDMNYNLGVKQWHQRPIMRPPGDKIGGHCVIPGVAKLNEFKHNMILDEILRLA